ncbi:MAG: MBL fold metallo-hydrolase, partial [Planctomycetes bacterium]|nr:MBL fold metallo-hydrolase [Planctomycetota bacterium]
MEIRFWGVRGSIAVAGAHVARIGGNTTCVEVEHDGARLIIDAGTGVRALGERLGGPVDATFLFTHLHWDHIQGFPFFKPAYMPASRLRLYGPVSERGATLEEVLAAQMQPPGFPVPLAAMGAEKRFESVAGGASFAVGPFVIRTQALFHPQGSIAYRVEAGGASMCFATDTEIGRDPEVDESLVALARDVDLLIHDAQYTDEEYATRRGWGHSTYRAA